RPGRPCLSHTGIRLDVEPIAAERAKPREKFKRAKRDPSEAVSAADVRDGHGLIDVESVVVRGLSGKNSRYARILLVFRPTGGEWVNPPERVRVSKQVIDYSRSAPSASDQTVTVDYEVKLPRKQDGPIRIPCVAHCRLAGTESGVIRYAFEVTIAPTEKAKPQPHPDRS
ncbi:MAG: hypothetical protein ACE5EC_07680, partial [Phycisphaerae bacterium]